MTRADALAFATSGSRTGKLATVRADGSPHVVPVWFDVDPATGDVLFLTRTDSVKGRNMARDARVSLSVDEQTFPFSFARLDGTVTLTPYEADPEAVRHWATETCRRYVGDERATAYGERNGVPGESLVRMSITKTYGEFDLAD